MVIEEADSEEEINDEELFQHSNNPKVLKLMDKLLRKDPNTYFFKLAQSGAKFPIEFNVKALKDPHRIPLGDNSVVREIPKPLEIPNMPLISKCNDQPMENPLYRKPTQIEQVTMAQQYQGGPSQYMPQGNNPPPGQYGPQKTSYIDPSQNVPSQQGQFPQQYHQQGGSYGLPSNQQYQQ